MNSDSSEGTAGSGQAIKELFDQAYTLVGESYLEHEQQLRDYGPEAIAFLRQEQEDSDEPFRKFMANTIADWIEGKGSDYEPAMEKLENIEERVKSTPSGVPRSDIAAGVLTQFTGDSLVNFIALRLVKEPDWPGWQVDAALIYLDEHRAPSAIPALTLYSAATRNSDRRYYALKIIARSKSKSKKKRQKEPAHSESQDDWSGTE